MKKIILVFMGILFLTSCGNTFEPDVYSKEDMCIVQKETEEKICYGMSRENIEEILGDGTEGSFGWMDYNGGVTVAYREGKAAGLVLEKESAGQFQTAREAKIGMNKEELKQRYGKKHAVKSGERNLDYFYDSKEKQPLNQLPRRTQKEMEDVYIFSFMFNDNGADRILLLDARMAMYFK